MPSLIGEKCVCVCLLGLFYVALAFAPRLLRVQGAKHFEARNEPRDSRRIYMPSSFAVQSEQQLLIVRRTHARTPRDRVHAHTHTRVRIYSIKYMRAACHHITHRMQTHTHAYEQMHRRIAMPDYGFVHNGTCTTYSTYTLAATTTTAITIITDDERLYCLFVGAVVAVYHNHKSPTTQYSCP